MPSTRNPTRVGTPPEVSSVTLEIAIGLSRSAMPPLICFDGLGRVWRFTIPMPSTRTLPRSLSTCSTRPVLPLSLPAMTLTVSSSRILIFTGGRGLF